MKLPLHHQRSRRLATLVDLKLIGESGCVSAPRFAANTSLIFAIIGSCLLRSTGGPSQTTEFSSR